MAARRVETWTALGLLVLVATLALLAQNFTARPEQAEKSVESTQPGGRRALLLVLHELGLEAAAWTRAPGSLPHGGGLVWLPRAPQPWHARAEDGAAREHEAPQRATALASHDLAHYKRFVEEGGTLLAALDPGLRRFLEDQLGLEGLADVEFADRDEGSAQRVRLASGEELELELEEGHAFRALGADSPARELWVACSGPQAAPRELPLALELPLGAGRVVLLADDSFVRNDELDRRQNALAAVRLVEELGRGAPLRFDEYALGTWEPQSALALSFAPSVALLSLHALLLLALFVWRRAAPRAFPRDPPPLAAVSPLERARAQARLWRATGRTDAPHSAAPRAQAPRPARADPHG